METEAEQTKIRKFQTEIINYWEKHGRKTLPWRLTRDPWKLLLAEILLRKTTSAQAEKVFIRLVNLSPAQIIEMETSVLEEILKPLGLSKVRADGIKRISYAVSRAEPEQFLSDSFLRQLPGVGRYISNTVRCQAFGSPVPSLDTNMIRILSRVFGWTSTRKRPREDAKLWEIAGTIVPYDYPRQFNWGILDFGAAVCTARKPKCSTCPLQDICIFYSKNRTE